MPLSSSHSCSGSPFGFSSDRHRIFKRVRGTGLRCVEARELTQAGIRTASHAKPLANHWQAVASYGGRRSLVLSLYCSSHTAWLICPIQSVRRAGLALLSLQFIRLSAPGSVARLMPFLIWAQEKHSNAGYITTSTAHCRTDLDYSSNPPLSRKA